MPRACSIALLLASCWAHAQVPVSIAASLSPQEIPFHRTATYTLRLETGPGGAVEFPDLSSVEPDLTIRKGDTRIEETETASIYEQDYTLDAVRAGVYFLPETNMEIEGVAVTVPPMALTVRELTEDELAQAQQFMDVPLPDAVEPRQGLPLWAYAAIAGFVVALLAAGLWLWRRKLSAPAAPPAPPWETALHRLKELEARQLPEQGQHERYYVDLSDILRYYIAQRFQIGAPEQTTPEFMDVARNSGKFTDEQQEALFQLMRHCDIVKFAASKPAMEEMRHSLATVRGFVEDTVPRLEAEDTTEKERAA